jgi:hypothetical protein
VSLLPSISCRKKSRIILVAMLLFTTLAHAKDPNINFMMECQGCHSVDGSGQGDVIPTLKNNMAKFLTVPGGREFLVQVPGAAQAPLSNAETADILNWMLRRFGPQDIAEKYAPYTEEEVAALRKTPLTEVKQKRAALVKLIEQQEKKIY